METAAPTVSEKPVGHDGTKVSITEHPSWVAGPAAAIINLVVIIALLVVPLFTLPALFIPFVIIAVLLISMFRIMSPGHTQVNQFLGRYVGTKGEGLRYNFPYPVGGVVKPNVGQVNSIQIGYRAGVGAQARPRDLPEESLMLTADENIVVVGPDDHETGKDAESKDSVADMVEQPAKVMRIGTMIKQLLEEVRAAPLDEASRNRLREIHQTSIRELEDGLAPELREELERLALPFSDDSTPSDAELRIAQAQLVGWLEGLFHGIQTALFAQQMAARAQLEQMRQGALPPGMPAPGGAGGPGHSTGQYL